MNDKKLGIFLLIMALCLSACSQEETPTQTATKIPSTPTTISTATPQPTDTPAPTNTPTPPPTETPTPADPLEILQTAIDALNAAESYRSSSEIFTTLSLGGMIGEVESIRETVVQPPNRWRTVSTSTAFGDTIVNEYVWIDDVLYIRHPATGRWAESSDPTLSAAADMWTTTAFLKAAEYDELVLIGEETLSGQPVYHLQGELANIDEEINFALPVGLWFELTALGYAFDMEADIQADYWIGVQDGRFVEIALLGEIQIADAAKVDSPEEVTLLVDAASRYTEYDELVFIEAPEDFVSGGNTITAVPAQDSTSESVCLLLDIAGEYDKGYNENTLGGAVAAGNEQGLEIRYAVAEDMSSSSSAELIEDFAVSGCDLIITVGFLMADATAEIARIYPDVRFAIVDIEYFPGFGCDPSAKSCYDEELSNITSLMFAEDEAGYLAGVMAGCMSETGVIGSVSGLEIPPVVEFVTGYQNGARSQNPDIETLNVYIPDFNDPSTGMQVAEVMINDHGADVIYGVGGNTGNGGLLAAHQAGIFAIGIDVDEYYTYPDIASSLLTSAVKEIESIVHDAVTRFANGELQAGVFLGTVANGGVGLAPYHDLDSTISETCKEAVAAAMEGLASGSIDTGYPPSS